jgi:hypothetical protein
MEAMTDEILRGAEKVVQGVEKEPEVEEKSKIEDSVKLTLNSQGYQDFKLIVKPVSVSLLSCKAVEANAFCEEHPHCKNDFRLPSS